MRSDYRVNVSNETVDVEFDGQWLRLPEGALSVESMGGGETCWDVEVRTANGMAVSHEATPAGDYKKRRQLIGTLSKDGVFHPGK